MKGMISGLCCLVLALMTQIASATAVRDSFTFTIYQGWNAVYLPVTPKEGADEFFKDWPTDAVGFYDQAAFLRTQQFSTTADDGSLGAVENGMKMWVRDNPGVSTFSSLCANGIYFFNVTNDIGGASISKTVYGVPEPARISWHVALSTNAPLNFVGVAVAPDQQATLTEEGYYQGLDTGWTWAKGYLFDPWGFDAIPSLNYFDGDKLPTKPNGGVVAMDAAKASDWSGAFFVSPYGGIQLGTNACQGVLTVRNDAGTNRTVRISFRSGAYPSSDAIPPMPTVMAKEDGVTGSWNANLAATPFVRELAAGETLRLVLAVDRTSDAWVVAAGTEYGGVIDVTDVSSERPTHFQTHCVFSVISDGGAYKNNLWPKGLWLAEVALDKVTQIVPKEQVTSYVPQIVTNTVTYMVATSATERVAKESGVTIVTNYVDTVVVSTNMLPVYTTEPVKAGSTMRVRMLVHVDALGAMTLLQRVKIGDRRISSLALPTDAPAQTGSGAFGDEASFSWTVGASSRANPFRHARHPDHGEENLFAVSNVLQLKWDAHGGTAWNPEETLSGTADWTFTGLRREGGIRTTGEFMMRRISKADLTDVQEW